VSIVTSQGKLPVWLLGWLVCDWS